MLVESAVILYFAYYLVLDTALHICMIEGVTTNTQLHIPHTLSLRAAPPYLCSNVSQP